MELKVDKSVLQREMSLLAGIVEKKTTIPILTNILIEVLGEKTVSMCATDLDVSLESACTAEVIRTGSVVVSGRKIFDIVRSLPEGEMVLSKEENDWLRVVSGSTQFKVVAQAKEHFPSTPRFTGGAVMLEGSVLGNLINRTICAITQEESKYSLNGALFSSSQGKVQMVTTDGHRLAIASCQLSKETEDFKVIIPKKALSELAHIAISGDEIIEFGKDENHLYFKAGQRNLTSRMIAGQFPNYELVIPRTNDKTIVLDGEVTAQAIRRVSLMADERSHGVVFEIKRGQIEITSKTSEMGEAKETLPVKYDGDTIRVSYSANYLLDFFSSMGAGEAIIEFKDDQVPALMRPAEPGRFEHKYIIMPMRLG